jgi:excisionase family DNA binding protein
MADKDTKKSKQEDKAEPLATLAEIASMLRMSPVQVRKMAQSRQIPAVKVDGEWRFNKDLVRQAILGRSRGKL